MSSDSSGFGNGLADVLAMLNSISCVSFTAIAVLAVSALFTLLSFAVWNDDYPLTIGGWEFSAAQGRTFICAGVAGTIIYPMLTTSVLADGHFQSGLWLKSWVIGYVLFSFAGYFCAKIITNSFGGGRSRRRTRTLSARKSSAIHSHAPAKPPVLRPTPTFAFWDDEEELR